MKILIVSYLFAPNNLVGALRATKLADFFSKRGHCVDVVTYGGKKDLSYAVPSGIRNIYTMVPYEDKKNLSKYKAQLKTSFSTSNSPGIRVLKWGYTKYLEMKAFFRERPLHFFKDLYKKVLKDEHYDTIISTYGPLINLEWGLYFNKKSPEVKWICDFRDPVVGETTPLRDRRKGLRLQKKACERADVITIVSNGYMEKICGEQYKEKRYMLPNGYDDADIADLSSATIAKATKLTFVYTGAFYAGKRDISIIFQALQELKNEKRIELNDICFQYAGDEFYIIREQATKYDCEAILENCGRLQRKDCLELQLNANVLVLATWNTVRDKGIFPGKFLEYMLMKKPIISITSGGILNGEVTSVMREGNLGVAYESANAQEDFINLKEYLLAVYNQFIGFGEIKFNPNKEVVERYNYASLIKRWEELL